MISFIKKDYTGLLVVIGIVMIVTQGFILASYTNIVFDIVFIVGSIIGAVCLYLTMLGYGYNIGNISKKEICILVFSAFIVGIFFFSLKNFVLLNHWEWGLSLIGSFIYSFGAVILLVESKNNDSDKYHEIYDGTGQDTYPS